MTDQEPQATEAEIEALVLQVDALADLVRAALAGIPRNIAEMIQTHLAPFHAHLAQQQRDAGGFTLH